jgi:hypothetical protein
MNPLNWRREHQVAWASVSLIGGMLGVLMAWSSSPLYNETDDFSTLLLGVSSYWPWPVLGTFISALAFYTVQLLAIADQEAVFSASCSRCGSPPWSSATTPSPKLSVSGSPKIRTSVLIDWAEAPDRSSG